MPDIPGIDHPMVMTYAELVRGERTRRRRASRSSAPGGIGVDVSEFLTDGALAGPRPRVLARGVGRG